MPSRQQYNVAFLAALDRLNPRQREAVEHIEGPVLVIAGPGTGKTHILTARIGRILLETDTQPHNILCLTFTDAGVRAMRERLLEFIGPEAHRVHIYTFHSFCNSIIQDNLELFGRHDLEPLSELERVELIRGIIDELDVDHPLRRGHVDIYFYEQHLHDLFQRMKAEDWTVEHVHRQIEAYLAGLPQRPDYLYQRKSGRFQKGDLKVGKIAEETRRMERLRAGVDLFPRYVARMRQARRYDYEDMILWVLRAFEEHEDLLRSYQEQYLYFLVDEYQDTNGAQNEVLQRLIGYWENPNVFIVGDDDQSIFEFQGARLKNLTDFYRRYRENLHLVLLRDNYRSSQLILDTSRSLIRHNERRIVNSLRELGIEKVLQAGNAEVAASALRPQIIAYPNRMQEETDIVDQVAGLWEQGVDLNEVAVIYARHRQASTIVDLLEKRGIPYRTRRKVNILHLPLIQNLRSLLEYLDLESRRPHSGEPLLFRILHYRFLGIPPADTARLSTHLAGYPWEERPPWREAIADSDRLRRLGLQAPERISTLSALIDALLQELHQLPLPTLVERLINRSGLLNDVLQHPERGWRVQVLKSFFDFVRQESERRPRLQLKELLELLHRMDANRLSIEVNREMHAERGVNLLTAHSAKGLEFRYVFLIDCVEDYWEPRRRGSRYRFPLPDTLTWSGEEDALEARRRLFYVAMTRAREHLHISYSRQDKAGKDLQRAIFIDEITQGMGLEENFRQVPEERLLDAQILHLQESARPRLPEQDAAATDALLEGFSLSISALSSYLRCPLGFYYEYVLRAPVQESESAAYGSAVHNALQRYFEQMLRDPDHRFPAREVLIRLFEREMRSLRGQVSPEFYEQRLESGRRHLAAYYDRYHADWSRHVRIEQHLRNAEIDGVPISGTIDRLDLSDRREVHIVDYKTGAPKSDRLRRPTPARPEGGAYWRQLVFYKLLYEHADAGDRTVATGAISFIEPDADGYLVEETLTYHPKDLEAVRRLIRESYAAIRRHEFQGCGERRCSWCTFVRYNILVDSFADREVEDLDD